MEQTFSQVVDKDRAGITGALLEMVSINKKGTTYEDVKGYVKAQPIEFSFQHRDLPPHTFTPTTYHYVLTEIKKKAKKEIRLKIADKHIWVSSVRGEMREGRDEEFIKNLFDGKKMTMFELTVKAWVW